MQLQHGQHAERNEEWMHRRESVLITSQVAPRDAGLTTITFGECYIMPAEEEWRDEPGTVTVELNCENGHAWNLCLR